MNMKHSVEIRWRSPISKEKADKVTDELYDISNGRPQDFRVVPTGDTFYVRIDAEFPERKLEAWVIRHLPELVEVRWFYEIVPQAGYYRINNGKLETCGALITPDNLWREIA